MEICVTLVQGPLNVHVRSEENCCRKIKNNWFPGVQMLSRCHTWTLHSFRTLALEKCDLFRCSKTDYKQKLACIAQSRTNTDIQGPDVSCASVCSPVVHLWHNSEQRSVYWSCLYFACNFARLDWNRFPETQWTYCSLKWSICI